MLIFYLLKGLCSLLMQNLHKIVRIYADIVQNPTLPRRLQTFVGHCMCKCEKQQERDLIQIPVVFF